MTSIAHSDPCVNECTKLGSIPTQRSNHDLLAAANERLLARRAELAARSKTESRESSSVEQLPSHLGWGSANLQSHHLPNSNVLPKKETRVESSVLDALRPIFDNLPENTQHDDVAHQDTHSDEDSQNRVVIVQPSLLAGILKDEAVAVGRIYLLCRHLDTDGRGWLSIADLRAHLTDKQSPLHVCGWRRLRQILQEGKGKFWERDDQDRLWIYGLTRVAATLNVQYFSGDKIELPLDILCGNIGGLRAAFFAAFHGGRESSPIARATLRDITGVPERTQRLYDKTQNIECTENYTLSDASNAPDTYYTHGRAAFAFIDKTGQHGQAGKEYIAIRLPNSYETPHIVRHPKKQTRLNKRLRKDLMKYGTRGNSRSSKERIYFTNGQQAAKCFSRSDTPIFLHDQEQGGAVFWIGFGRK